MNSCNTKWTNGSNSLCKLLLDMVDKSAAILFFSIPVTCFMGCNHKAQPNAERMIQLDVNMVLLASCELPRRPEARAICFKWSKSKSLGPSHFRYFPKISGFPEDGVIRMAQDHRWWLTRPIGSSSQYTQLWMDHRPSISSSNTWQEIPGIVLAYS